MKLSEKDIILFEPSKRDMIIDYPELKEYEVFTNITPADLKFVWYISNRTSPIIRESKQKRLKMACELAYDEKRLSTNARIKSMYVDREFPDNIVEAIMVMANFNPSFRMRAKMLNEHNFNILQSLSYISEEERMTWDIDEKKKCAELIVKTTSALASMIVNMESGYGVKIKKEVKAKFELKANITDVIDRVEKIKT